MTTDYEPYVRIEYSAEVSQLPQTYAYAQSLDVTGFADWLRAHKEYSLLTIGAGGSLPVAQLAATLHTAATGQMARAGEPLDIFLGSPLAPSTAGLLVTASGGHSDSLAACQSLVNTPTPWAVFCGKESSAGADFLRDSQTPVFGYDLLPELHGWVAVNALLGQAVVIARAYAQAFPDELGELPTDLFALLPSVAGERPASVEQALEKLVQHGGQALLKSITVFLYGPDTKAAALDLDSKFAEAGLGHLVASEFRNFAHGRYQMMLPRIEQVGVVSLSSQRETAIAQKSLEAIPESVPTLAVATNGSSYGHVAEQVSALLSVLLLVGAIGQVKEMSPGWGSDDTFGDLLYLLDLGSVFELPPKHLLNEL